MWRSKSRGAGWISRTLTLPNRDLGTGAQGAQVVTGCAHHTLCIESAAVLR